jgi:hypothetical protein
MRSSGSLALAFRPAVWFFCLYPLAVGLFGQPLLAWSFVVFHLGFSLGYLV